jgi:hypothetical protein
MAKQNKVYKNPQAGQPLISVISSGLKSPILEIKFCNILKPFYYPNSPTIARYSITCLVDPEEHKEFLNGLRTIEANEKVASIIKPDAAKEGKQYLTTGKFLVKFQTKENIPIYVQYEDQEPEQIELEDEIAKGEKVSVIFTSCVIQKKA